MVKLKIILDICPESYVGMVYYINSKTCFYT